MKKTGYILFIILGIIIWNSSLWAGQKEIPEREALNHRIEMLKLYRLMSELNLDDTQTTKIMKVFQDLETKRRNIRKELRKDIQLLESILKESPKDEKQLVPIISEIEALNRQRYLLPIEEFEALKNILTPTQQAKYFLVMRSFMKEIKAMVRIIKRPPMGKAVYPSPPNKYRR